jgi:hypothetical protein
MRRSERLVRAAVVACLSTAVALAMHVAGGGAMPAAPGVLVPLLLAFAVSAQLAGAAMSRWRLATAVAAAQAMFHASFALGPGAHVIASGPHASHSPTSLTVESVGDHAAHSHLTPSMVGAHAVAAVATYVLLRRADVLVALILRAAASLVSRLEATAPRLTPHGVAPAFPSRTPAHTSIARSPRGLRGPPLRLA